MKVVVVGATGNVGTGTLRALHETPEVTEIVGISRRLPETGAAPYKGCEWHSVDIAAASTAEDAVAELSGIFEGADAVIHLAWLIQPNDQRELLRRVNVEGTRRVTEAVARAGVPHLVAASSVGAYSPDEARSAADTPPLRDEDFPTAGVDSSHYSVDKVAQEHVLDAFAAAHPEITVTRLRSAFTFQGDAASEIQRYFVGRAIPVQALKMGRLPALTLPKGLILQGVHADDAGRAYAAAVVRKLPGTFNIAADDLITPQDLADIVDHGHYMLVPPAVVRAALVTAHKSGLVPADGGWLDMAMHLPLLDPSRAREELGWQARVSAVDAFRELFEGMVDGAGLPSPPLVPRKKDERIVQPLQEPAGVGAHAGQGAAPEELPENLTRDLMGLYLSDHLTGATAGTNRIERMAADFVDTPVYAELAGLAEGIRANREFLRNLIEDLGFARRPHRQAAAWAVERVGRLKFNGRVLERSPMTMLLEAELMRSGVQGQVGLWETLQEHAGELGLDPEVFSRLIKDTHGMLETLEQIHAYARSRALRDDRETFWD